MRCLAAAAAYGSGGPSGAGPRGEEGEVQCGARRGARPDRRRRRRRRVVVPACVQRGLRNVPRGHRPGARPSVAQGDSPRRNRARRGRPARVDGAPHAANAVGATAAGPAVPLSAAIPPAPILSMYAAAPVHAAWLVALRAMAASRPAKNASYACRWPRARPPCPGCGRRWHACAVLRACRAIMLRGRAGSYAAPTTRKQTVPAGQAKDVTQGL